MKEYVDGEYKIIEYQNGAKVRELIPDPFCPEPAPPPDTTMEEYLIDLDFRLSNIELGL